MKLNSSSRFGLVVVGTLAVISVAACSSGGGGTGQSTAGAGGVGAGGGAAGSGGATGGSGGSGPVLCSSNADCIDHPNGPVCDTVTGSCGPVPGGGLIGWGDGSVSSVSLVEVYRPDTAIEATDLAFHPERDELWVINRRFEVQGTCAQSDPSSARCRSLGGTTTIISAPGTPQQTEEVREDQNSWHFMRRPPALAMGAGDTFATCGEAATGNFENDAAKFIGPALWSSDLNVYARPSGGNGSHLDMLHASPFCMGIAHETANAFWVFNGDVGSLDRYDFGADHGPGNADHSDGRILRYVVGGVTRVAGVPSHLVFDADDAALYIADSGNSRVAKLDTKSGTKGGPIPGLYEVVAESGVVAGSSLTDVVAAGLDKPSGIALHQDVLYVSDNATSTLHAYDLQGTLLRSLATNFPAGSLAGLEVGRDGKLWFSDMKSGAVYRIDPM